MAVDLWVIFLSGFLIFLGLLGAVLPFLPGPPLALAGLVIFALATGFAKVSVITLVVFTGLALLSLFFDIFGPALVAKGYKASRYGIVGAILGGILGVLLMGPFGVVLGPVIGAFAGEYLASRDSARALKTTWAALLGFLAGTVLKLAVTVAMAIYFVFALF